MQPLKLITTLGTGNYEPTRYRLSADQESSATPFFPLAVVQWFRPQQVYVLLTDTAQKHQNWKLCQEELAKNIPAENIQEVHIPDGKSEQELWQIFEAIAGVVSEDDRVVVDVTHGFRSLPMLILLALAYLRQVKGIQVESILYGAREAQGEQEVAPVFDLTPFVSLLDWLAAAKIFMTTGDGRELAELMESTQNQARRTGAPNPPQQLKPLARSVREVSDNLLLSRAPSVANSVKELQSKMGQEGLTTEINNWLPPLIPLFNQIQQRYTPFAEDDLSTQLKLIRWYMAHGHLVQAYTLAREWLVNYQLQREGLADRRDDKDTRKQVEKRLNESAKKLQDGDSESKANPVVLLWDALTEYRNDIAHCGFRKHPKPAETLKGDLGRLIEQMESLLVQGKAP